MRKASILMRLLICAGGTGGGVYPALAVLQALKSEYPVTDPAVGSVDDLSVLWVGGAEGLEVDLVRRAGVPFEAIPAAGVHGVGLRALPGNLFKLGKGYFRARSILRRFQPDVLFFTGGYVAVPMALAGRRVPTALYVPDIEPGLALKVLARFADRVAVTTEDTITFFRGKPQITLTGYPIRPELKTWERPTARRALGLNEKFPVLLVFGGSKGAHSINRALLAALPQLLPDMQIIHITGRLDWDEVEIARNDLEKRLSPRVSDAARYHAYPYLYEEMGAALSAADLVVARAGASTLGEFPLFGLPAVLVPYPFAWRYQKVNAEFLEKRGAAVVVADEDLPVKLAPIVLDLVRDQKKLAQMGQAMENLAKPGAARSIAHLIEGLAVEKGQKGKRP